MSDLGVGADYDGSRCVITVSGEARLETAASFERVAHEIEARGVDRVLVDMTQLSFMDSASAGMLLKLRKQMRDADGAMVLFGMRKLVARLFERTGLVEQFQCADSREEADALLD